AIFTIELVDGQTEVTEDPTDADANQVSYRVSYVVSNGGTVADDVTISVDVNIDHLETKAKDFTIDVAQALATAIAAGTTGVSSDGATLTFAGGAGNDTELTFTLEVDDDPFAEGDEAYAVRLSGETSNVDAIVSIDVDEVGGTIIDNDEVIFFLTGPDQVTEGEGATYTVGFRNVDGTFGAIDDEEETSVAIAHLLDGTPGQAGDEAEAADFSQSLAFAIVNALTQNGITDARIAGGRITFFGGLDATKDITFDLPILDDLLVEGDETYAIELSNSALSTTAPVSINPDQDFVATTIIDNDELVFSITGSESVTEDATDDDDNLAVFTVSYENLLPLGDTATIDVAFLAGTTEAEDLLTQLQDALQSAADNAFGITVQGTTIVFNGGPASDRELTFALEVFDDLITEGDEQFAIELSNPTISSEPMRVSIGEGLAETVIIDNDVIEFFISAVDRVTEDADPLDVEEDDIADDDNVVEYELRYEGTLVEGETVSVDVHFNFDLVGAGITPASEADFLQSLTEAVFVAAGLIDSIDFAVATNTVTFTAGAGNPQSLLFSLEVIDDDLAEGDETYQVVLENDAISVTGQNDLVTITEGVAETVIEDDDPVIFSLTGDGTVNESLILVQRQGNYTLSHTNILVEGETASVDLVHVLNQTEDADFEADLAASLAAAVATGAFPNVTVDGTRVTFTGAPNAVQDFDFILTANDDRLVEGPEIYSQHIENPAVSNFADFGIDVAADRVETTIIDNDEAVFRITSEQPPIVWEDPNRNVNDRTAVFTLSHEDLLPAGVTASVGIEYVAGDTNDSDFIGTFLVNLLSAIDAANSGRAPNDPRVSYDPDTSRVTFYGNGGVDDLQSIQVSLLAEDDDVPEYPELFGVDIVDSAITNTGDHSVGTPSARMTLRDDDGFEFNLSSNRTSVTEDPFDDDNNQVTYTVSYDPARAAEAGLVEGESASIDISLLADSIEAGDLVGANPLVDAINAGIVGLTDDIQFDGSRLTFLGGDGRATAFNFTLTIVDDGSGPPENGGPIEGNESFRILLSNIDISTGAPTVIDDVTVSTTIINNPPTDPDSKIALSLVKVRTTPDSARDQNSSLPDSEEWIQEWDRFFVEVWVTTGDPYVRGIDAAVTGATAQVNFNTQYFSVVDVEAGGAFADVGGLFANIDEAGGAVSLDGTVMAPEAEIGNRQYVLLATIEFAANTSDAGVPFGLEDGEYVHAVAPGWIGLDDTGTASIETAIQTIDNPVLGEAPATELYPMLFDMTDTSLIGFSDLALFSAAFLLPVTTGGQGNAFNGAPLLGSPTLTTDADFNHDGRVNFEDLTFFQNNFFTSRVLYQDNPANFVLPPNFPDAWRAAPLTVASGAVSTGDAGELSYDELNPIVEQAISRLSESATPEQLEQLRSLEIRITDLAGGRLAQISGDEVTIDFNAAGIGWFIDETPQDDVEYDFAQGLSAGQAREGSPAADHIDLLSAVMHEMGHALGHDHEESGVMQSTLRPGERRVLREIEEFEDADVDLDAFDSIFGEMGDR
ncbi:MAG: hypothetical protein KDA42_01985, partial [Planctomycetales bacterium]|nr:hypothetical protein [Planctomycetales bacterium]